MCYCSSLPGREWETEGPEERPCDVEKNVRLFKEADILLNNPLQSA